MFWVSADWQKYKPKTRLELRYKSLADFIMGIDLYFSSEYHCSNFSLFLINYKKLNDLYGRELYSKPNVHLN